MTSIFTQKKQLRTEASARRTALAAKYDVGDRFIKIFRNEIQLKPGMCVSGYYPIASEANVMLLLCDIGTRGFDTALPVVAGREDPLTFREWRESDPMDKGPFGIPEPRTNAEIIYPDVILAPLLAFDRTGNRLGYGGGYYDRTIIAIRQHKPVLAIGVAYAAQEVDSVPHDSEDVALDWVMTEKEAFAVDRGK